MKFFFILAENKKKGDQWGTYITIKIIRELRNDGANFIILIPDDNLRLAQHNKSNIFYVSLHQQPRLMIVNIVEQNINCQTQTHTLHRFHP